MNYKFARFFTIRGKMQWDSIKDEADLRARHMSNLQNEVDELMGLEDALAPGGALTKVGGWLMTGYAVFVRVGL